MSAQNKRRNVLIGFGAVAVVLVAVVAVWPPDWPREDASGAIGAVEKHRQTQITESDVVLVDEATRQQEAVVYADYLDDAAKLQNISVELSAALRDSDAALQARATAARGTLLKHEEALQARYVKNFASTLDAISRSVAANEFVLEASRKAQLQSDIEQLSAKLRGMVELQSEEMAALNARLKNIDEQLQAKVLGARKAGAGQLEDAAQLESDFAALESRGRLQSAEFESLSARLNAVSADLNEARGRLVANQDYLQSLAMESRTLRAAREGLSDLNQARLQSISASLASEAAMLEAKATRNLDARLKNDSEMAARMKNFENALGSAKRVFAANEAMLDARLKSSFDASLENAEQFLGARQAQYQARMAGRFQMELASIARHMKNRDQIAARLNSEEQLAARLKSEEQLASGARPALQARALGSTWNLAARNFNVLGSAAGFQQYLANLDQALNANRAFESLAQREQFALEARGLTQQLQARAR